MTQITAAEVKGWFGTRKRPSDDQCAEIAKKLTRFRRLPIVKKGRARKTEAKHSTEPVDTLLAAIPDYLRLYERTGASDSQKIIKELGVALTRARPIIQFPLGPGERQTPQQRPRTKPWHLPSVLIGNIIAEALVMSGHAKAGLSHRSAVVGAVHHALAQKGYGDIANAAISAHLKRRADKHGGLGRPDTSEMKKFKAAFRAQVRA